MQQGESAYIDQGVGQPDRRHHRHGDRLVERQPDDGERGSPERNPDAEAAAEATDADQPQGRRRAEESTDTDGRVQVTEPGVADIQQLQREYDGQHQLGAADQHLGGHQAHHETQPGLGGDDTKAGGGFARERLVLSLLLGRAAFLPYPGHKARRPDQGCDGEEDRLGGSGGGQYGPRHGRPQEEGDAVDRARGQVGGGELLGRASQGWNQG